MSRFVVTANAMGVPTARIPLPLIWDLAKLFPAEKMVVAYHHETNQVLVNFPDWDTPTVQKILDDLGGTAAPAFEGFAIWPGLHADGPLGNRCTQTDPVAGNGIHNGDSVSGGILAEMRGVMDGLTPAQQDKLTRLVCGLNTALAVERLCFRKLFEASPDGYVATDLGCTVEHANEAMYKLLGVSAPHLDGKPLLMFFTPHSKALIQQRLRLLRTGISEAQPFTDIQAQINLCDEDKLSVSMRLIMIKSENAALSTIRWLIRQVA